MNKINPHKTIQWLKKYIVWFVLLIAIVLLISGKPFYDSYLLDKLNKEYELKEQEYKEAIDCLNQELKLADEKDAEIVIIDNGYKKKYKDEYAKRIAVEKSLNDIRYRIYDYEYLDSLAKYVKFR